MVDDIITPIKSMVLETRLYILYHVGALSCENLCGFNV